MTFRPKNQVTSSNSILAVNKQEKGKVTYVQMDLYVVGQLKTLFLLNIPRGNAPPGSALKQNKHLGIHLDAHFDTLDICRPC